MEKRLFLLFTIIFSISSIHNANNIKTKEEIRKDIDQIFRIEILEFGERKSPFMFVDTLKENHYLFSFINDNNLILDYLLENQLQINYDTLKILVNDREKLKSYFKNSINSDTSFCNNVIVLANNYINKNIRDIDSIEYSSIANLAVRFYYPIVITENDKINTKICVGIHGLKDYGGKRDYIKEAFAFSVIFSQLQENNEELYHEYIKTLKEVKDMYLSSDRDTKLKRIQGAVWALLLHNKLLRKAIYSEYNKKKSYLPFYIK